VINVAKATSQRWQTRPLESWQKCKELRLDAYKEIATAREEGKLVATGSVGESVILPAGLGPFVHLGAEPYGASVSADPGLAQACTEAYEARGFARDTCAYFRNYLGSMYLDRYCFGGRFPKPDIIIQTHTCDSHAKWFQIVAEHYGMPFFGLDVMPGPSHGPGLDRRVQYLAEQLYDCIEWMEKVTGREYEDELFIEAIHDECEAETLFAESCYLNQAIPAPLDQKMLFTLYAPAAAFRYKKESVEFYRMLRDEVKERADNQIAAVASERCRLLHDSQPPWFFLRLYRIMEQYGAVCVGSQYCYTFSNLILDEDGHWVPGKTPREAGIELRTRDDAVRYYAWKSVSRPAWEGMFHMATYKSHHILTMVDQWHVDGVIIHLNRGCEGLDQHQLETRLALLRAGIPTMTYEGNMADKREFDEAQVIDRLESFMESLGLRKLEVDKRETP
jgi:benzoyl-CoA reductase subunit B